MVQTIHRLKESPSQTAGPYVHIGCTPNFCGIEGVYPDDAGSRMITGEAKGERIILSGVVIDGGGQPVRDALVEIWQADSAGFYNADQEKRGRADPAFTGWGRCAADQDSGLFRFETVKPGQVPYKDGRPMAPHITVWVAARGINIALQTRAYFPDEAEANAADPVLGRVDPSRRGTLLAVRDGEENGMPVYRFDVRLQGENETVFFDI